MCMISFKCKNLFQISLEKLSLPLQVDTAAAIEGLNSKTIGGLAMVSQCSMVCVTKRAHCVVCVRASVQAHLKAQEYVSNYAENIMCTKSDTWLLSKGLSLPLSHFF